MNSTIDIAWWQLAIFSSVLIIPVMVSRIYQLGISKEIFISVGRMTVQLILVGMYLEYLFKLNSIWVNLIWLSLMILVGASSIVSKTHLPTNKLLVPIVLGLAAGLFPIVIILCFGIVQPSPWYSAQYLIPLAGMLLGNSLSGNIVALQNLFTAFEERKSE